MLHDITNCIKTLNAGGSILYPTDTVWGIGCDATNEQAVENIFRIKQRSQSTPLIILVDSVAMLERYVDSLPDTAYDLFEYATSPLTLVLDSPRNLARNALNADGSVGIRITNEEFSHTLLSRFRRPIISTSANIHGEPTPHNFLEISKNIISSVEYVVSYRQNDTKKSSPSSIIKINNQGVFTILRK